MSRTYHHGERHIRVRGIRQDPTDLRRLSRALLDLAQAQAEAEAEAEHKAQRPHRTKSKSTGKPKRGGSRSRKEAA